MGPRRFNPRVELEAALKRGELGFASALAAELAEDRRRPLDLQPALRFLPLVAAQRPEHFDAWALRWLLRWVSEAPAPTIEEAAEVAAALADLPLEPNAALGILKGRDQPD
jgi:hypothetical protein